MNKKTFMTVSLMSMAVLSGCSHSDQNAQEKPEDNSTTTASSTPTPTGNDVVKTEQAKDGSVKTNVDTTTPQKAVVTNESITCDKENVKSCVEAIPHSVFGNQISQYVTAYNTRFSSDERQGTYKTIACHMGEKATLFVPHHDSVEDAVGKYIVNNTKSDTVVLNADTVNTLFPVKFDDSKKGFLEQSAPGDEFLIVPDAQGKGATEYTIPYDAMDISLTQHRHIDSVPESIANMEKINITCS